MRLKHILVSRLRFMGDVILTTPVLHALKIKLPEVKITYLTEKPFAALLENHPWVDDVLTLDRSKNGNQKQLIHQLLVRKFDAAIDLFGNPRSALLMLASGARMRIGGNFRIRKWAYTHRIRGPEISVSAVDFHMRYLQPLLDIVPEAGPTRVQPTEEEKWRAKHYLAGLGYNLDKPIVGIHPGATWPAKRWMPERFAALADFLKKRRVQVLLTMGPGEEKLIRQILDLCDSNIPFPSVLPLGDLAAMIDSIQVYIANDCGPMHLGPAVGTRTVGLFGPGEPEIWFPYRREDGYRVIHHNVACSRCHKDECNDMRCMHAIKVEEVAQTALELLK